MIFVSLKYDVFQASDFNFKGQDFLICYKPGNYTQPQTGTHCFMPLIWFTGFKILVNERM